MATEKEKSVMVVGIDDSTESFYALEWTLDRLFSPFPDHPPFTIVIVHAKTSPSSAVGFSGPGAIDVLPFIEVDLRNIAATVIGKAKAICNSKSVALSMSSKWPTVFNLSFSIHQFKGAVDVLPFIEVDLRNIAARVSEKAKALCNSKSVDDVIVEVVEGDPRNVLCEAVEKYQAAILVVGSHGYGAIKRAVLGSVSDYCVHQAHCTVMIVKKPKHKQ